MRLISERNALTIKIKILELKRRLSLFKWQCAADQIDQAPTVKERRKAQKIAHMLMVKDGQNFDAHWSALKQRARLNQ